MFRKRSVFEGKTKIGWRVWLKKQPFKQIKQWLTWVFFFRDHDVHNETEHTPIKEKKTIFTSQHWKSLNFFKTFFPIFFKQQNASHLLLLFFVLKSFSVKLFVVQFNSRNKKLLKRTILFLSLMRNTHHSTKIDKITIGNFFSVVFVVH